MKYFPNSGFTIFSYKPLSDISDAILINLKASPAESGKLNISTLMKQSNTLINKNIINISLRCGFFIVKNSNKKKFNNKKKYPTTSK